MKFSTISAALLPAVASAFFHCPTVNETGFLPSCCNTIVGQVGVWCTNALIIGSLPNFDCNTGPPLNVEGCCQSIGNISNPNTGYDLNLCTAATQIS